MHKLRMDGKQVYRFASRVLGEAVHSAVKKSGLAMGDVSLIIPHQANQRILSAAARKLQRPSAVCVPATSTSNAIPEDIMKPSHL